MKADLVVVGAGPSGSYAALTAATLGLNVVVCEEHREIGQPWHCSGHVSLSSMKKLGLTLPREIIENEIHGAIFYTPSGLEFVVERTEPVTMVMSRPRFDQYLAQLATEAGAEYRLGARVASFLMNDGEVKGVKLEGTHDQPIQSRIVIDAEGCGASLLRKTRLHGPERQSILNSVQVEVDQVDDIDASRVEVYLGQSYSPGFFSWIIPKRDLSAKVGLAATSGNVKRLLEKFMQKHPIASRKLRRAKIEKTAYHPIPLAGRLQRASHHGLMVVGDAASQVKPTTGGGIVVGMICSKLAAQVAVDSIKAGDVSGESLSRYDKLCRKTVGFDLKVMREIRNSLARLSDEKINKIFSMAKKFGLEELINEAGDVDFQGRMLLRMGGSPRTLLTIGYLVSLSIGAMIRSHVGTRRLR